MVSRNFSRVKSKKNYYIGHQKVPVDQKLKAHNLIEVLAKMARIPT